MAKTVDKRVNVWLNGQGIENNLKSVRAVRMTRKFAGKKGYDAAKRKRDRNIKKS